MATHIVSQICFDAEVITDWVQKLRQRGTHLPIWIGLPAPVDYRKLLRVSMKIGRFPAARLSAGNARDAAPAAGEPAPLARRRLRTAARWRGRTRDDAAARRLPAARQFRHASELVGLVLELLERDVVPVVPSSGSAGSSGDPTPLAHLAR